MTRVSQTSVSKIIEQSTYQALEQIYSQEDTNNVAYQVIDLLKAPVCTRIDGQVWGPVMYQINEDLS